MEIGPGSSAPGGSAPKAITSGGFAATYTTASAPASSVTGGNTGGFSRVITNVTYVGAVTAAVLRLWTRNAGINTPWFKGASSADASALTGTNEARVWAIPAGTEFLFTLESTTPGTAGNTVAVDCLGASL